MGVAGAVSGNPSASRQPELTVPARPTTLKELLPLVQTLSDAMVNAAVQEVEQLGAKVSCCKGCGACCRQLVPIAEVEARRLAEIVQLLPEPGQSQLRARFEVALSRLQEAGLLDKLHDPQRWHREGYVPSPAANYRSPHRQARDRRRLMRR
jgi:hypothetical protein